MRLWGRASLMIGSALGIPLLLVLYLDHLGLAINLSSSMPLGFYLRQSNDGIKSGDIVAACLSSSIAHYGRRRGYLHIGHCPGFASPVIKQVIAIPGDRVQVTSANIIVNEAVYDAPLQYRDHDGFVVKRFIDKRKTHVSNTYWLYGHHAPIHSWDSRYWGGVERSQILGVYRPLLTF